MGRRARKFTEEADIINLQSYIPSKMRLANPRPRNNNQRIYLDMLRDESKSIVLAVGPAGVGKSIIGVQYGIKLFQEKIYNKIIVTRPAVSVEEEIGFLPGTVSEKMAVWIQPVLDIFEEFYHPKMVEKFMEEKRIEIIPFAMMRGRSFNNAYIIAEEIQLTTPNQMETLLTRIGCNSKMVITGDLAQSDRCDNNGLYDFLQKLRAHNPENSYIDMIEFNRGDVERHPVVEEVLKIYGR